MKLLKTFSKLKKLRLKHINGKTTALFLLNRNIPRMTAGKQNFGKITDLHLDRKQKNSTFEITRNGEVNTVTVQGYKIVANKGKSFLSWQKLDCTGPAKTEYHRAFKGLKQLEIPKKYITIVEAAL